MKSFAFTLALIAAVNAVDIESVGYGAAGHGGYGRGYQTYTYPKTTTAEVPADTKATASQAYGAEAKGASASDWDAWGRDQDLSISESYGKTNAKSYAAESYDEWDNKDNDKWGAQAWGKDRDVYGASSYGKAASSADADRYGYAGAATGHKGYGGAAAQKWQGASAAHGAAQGGYDNDAWAKQAYGSDQDSRWGKSYDSVDAKSYDGEWYARSVKADDDQWAEDYDRYDAGSADSNGNAASSQEWRKPSQDKYGKGVAGGEFGAASKGNAAGQWGKSGSDWDSWGRDQDYSEDVSYDKVQAKAYSAESYDEWDNKDDDKWGAQAWGKDRDVYGASSQGRAASAQDWQGAGYGAKNAYGGPVSKGYGHHGHASGKQAGYGQGNRDWQGASAASQAQAGAYDNDEWAKQAYGSDFDSRWGKSYDSVSAKSYDNESYARAVQADDDQWAEDYDRYHARDANSRANAASKWGKESDSDFGPTYTKGGYGGYGHGSYEKGVNKGAVYDSASKDGKQDYAGKSGSDWDAWGRDQDLSIKESYDRTWAKSYDAESYDEWDNTDDDKWGAQAWGKDRDLYGASSQDYAASQGDYANKGNAYGGAKAYGGHQAGHGYGKGHSYGGKAGYGGQAYGANAERDASKAWGAQRQGYDNDEWAKQAYGVDTDSRWGKSYDSVAAKSYDDEQYARKVWADDDQWAEDYDRYNTRAADSHSKAASANDSRGAKTTHTVTPVTVKYGGYGGYGGHGAHGVSRGYGGYAAPHGQNSYGKW